MSPNRVALTLLVLAGCRPGDSGITKFNNEPEATITSHVDGDAEREGYVVTLRGTISDTNDNPDDLVATWYSGADELCATAPVESDGTTVCEAVLGLDDTEIVLEGQDDENASGVARVTLNIDPTDAPTAQITAPTATGVFYADVPVLVEALVGDTEDDPTDLLVEWVDGYGIPVAVDTTPDASGELSGTASFNPGTQTVTLTVTDLTGKTSTDEVTFEVLGSNTSPTCAITAPVEGGSAGLGTEVLFEGTVSDPDVDSTLLSATWTSDIDGTLSAGGVDSDGATGFSTSSLSYGTHLITLSGADEAGATCEASILFSVGAPPEVIIESPVDGDVYNEGDPVYFAATASDDSGDPETLTAEWSSDLDGTFYVSAFDAAGFVSFEELLTAGDHLVTLVVTDADGLYTEASVGVLVNDLPDAPTLDLSPAAPSTDDDLVVSIVADAFDAEGDAITYTYAWTRDGAATAYSGDTVPASATTVGETWEVTVTPSDGWGDGTPATASVTVGNSAPTLSDVTLSPDPAREGDTLACSPGTASDADGESVSFSYAWEVNGLAVSSTSAALGDTWWDRGDTATCIVTPMDGTTSGTAVRSNTVTIENSAPSLTSVSVSPANPSAGDTLVCSASGYSDADGDADASTYTWSVNGVDVGTGATLAGGFFGGDEVVCTVMPHDGTDAGTPISDSVTVGNTAPVLASVTLSPSSPTELDTLTCTPGATTDADGTTSFTYTYSWTVNSAVIGETGDTLDGTDFDKGDTVRCRVVPNDGTDDGSMVSSASVTIGNTAPAVSAASISPTSPDTNDTLSVSVTASDVDGDSLSYAYAWYVGGVAAGTGATLAGTAFSVGDSIYVVVTANDGTASSAPFTSAGVTVTNTAPEMTSVSISPTTAYEASTLTCTASGADADGDALTYTYAWAVNGTTVSSATSSTLTGTSFRVGDSVTCSAAPNDGTVTGTAMTSSAVTISNTAPVLASVSLSPTTAYEASTLTCSPGSTTDADGTTSFTYSYAWYVEGASVGVSASTLTGTYFGRGDDVYCTATPSDGTSSGSAVASSTVTISNTAPVISAASISPSSPTDSSTLSVSVTSSDADGDSVSYTYAWYVDGAMVATSSTLSTAYFGGGDVVYVIVTPTDGTTAGTAYTTATVTIAGSVPVMSSVTLTPTTAYESSTLTCSASATDADGDTISYSYAWYVNGSAISATSSTLTGSSFGRGDSVYCRVTPSDAGGSGTAMSSSSVTISNTAPALTSASLTPTTAYEASTLTCAATGSSDADGDSVSLSYAWYVNGSLISPTSSTLTGTYFNKGNTVYCRVTPNDGTVSGTAVTSSTVTISNTAPVISSVSLSPTLAYESSTLTCAPSSADADGDSVSYTYAWYVNSSLVSPTSSTLGGTYFSKGNTVYCRATPSDGSTSGTAVSSSSVTISNSTPSTPTVVISPEDPEAGQDDLLCEIDTSSTDADGDSLTYTFSWTVDGVAYTGATNTSTTSTVPKAATAEDDVWQCSARASDGTVSSGTATDSVDVMGASYTIGYASVFPTPATGSAGANYSLCQSQVVSSSVDLYALGTYLRLADTDSMRMAVYTSSGGAPSTLVGYTALTSLSTYAAGSFVELDVVGAPVAMSAGTYFICENFSGNVYIGYTAIGASTNTIYYNTLSSSSAWPSSWGTGSTYTGQFINLYMIVR